MVNTILILPKNLDCRYFPHKKAKYFRTRLTHRMRELFEADDRDPLVGAAHLNEPLQPELASGAASLVMALLEIVQYGCFNH